MQPCKRKTRCGTALLLIDVVNHFAFPGGERLLRNALRIAKNLVLLKQKAIRAGVPVIYVNDNFHQWQSNFDWLCEYCTRPEAPSRRFVEMIRPVDGDYQVLKPMHSAFYLTPLDVLLRHLGVNTVIVAGIATNGCVLATANDANMRGLEIHVPRDCCASESRGDHLAALRLIGRIHSVRTEPVARLRFGRRRKS